MRKKYGLGISLILAMGLLSCGSSKSVNQARQNSITGLNGVYTGTIPCADCEGIQTMIKFNKGGSYEREMTYLGKPARPFRDSGSVIYTSETGRVILQERNNPAGKDYFRFQGGKLTQTDGDGKLITGPLASHFIFQKNASPLVEQYWKLIAMDGKPIPTATSRNREPYLVFKAFDNRLSGNAGCNSFFGSYVLRGGQQISFSGMGATKMACPDMDVEDQFLHALNMVSHYRIQGDTLTMYPATGPASLQFVMPAR